MGSSMGTMSSYFISRTDESSSEETFSTFVVPNSVILSRRQTEILSSLETRQGVPFCLNDSGTLTKPPLEVQKKLKIARGLLVIEEDMVLIRPDGELRFKYTCFDCIEVQFHFFAKDSKLCDKIRIEKSMLKWGPIVLPVGKNKIFRSSKCAALRKPTSIPVSSLPFMHYKGRAIAGLYDVVIMVSPAASNTGAQSSSTTTNNNSTSSKNAVSITSNSSSFVQQEAFYFRVAKPKGESTSGSLDSSPSNQKVERLESFDGDEGARPTPISNTVHKAKVVLHRFMLAQGVYNDVGGVFSTSSTAPSADSERDGAVTDSTSPNTRTTHQQGCVGSEMDEKINDASDADESRPFPLSPRRSSGDAPSRAEINVSPEQDSNTEPRAEPVSDCVICMTAACDIINYPCRHSCMCLACASDIAAGATTRENKVKCPICRVAVKVYLRVVATR